MDKTKPVRFRAAPKSIVSNVHSQQATLTSSDKFEKSFDSENLSELQKSFALERQRLNTALKDETAKYERSYHHQQELENELVAKHCQIESLSSELKLIKQQKQAVDSELAQSLADFMNSQSRMMTEIDQLNDEVRLYKRRGAEANKALELKSDELTTLQKQIETEKEKKQPSTKANHPPDFIDMNSDKIQIYQNNLLISELRALHSKLYEEINDLKALNSRLTDHNEQLKEEIEQYQYILIEKTVSGEIGQHEVLGNESLLEMSEIKSQDGEHFANNENDNNIIMHVEANASSAPVSTETSSPEAKSISKQLINDDSLSSNESDSAAMQSTLKRYQFEITSLRNYNRALKISLERLVARLLENKSFNKAVEDSLSIGTVSNFRTRVKSVNEDSQGPGYVYSGNQAVHSGNDPRSAAVLSDMLINKNFTGNANRRVISLGVDYEVNNNTMPAPLKGQNTGATIDTLSSSDKSFPVALNRMYSMNHPFGKSRHGSPVAGDSANSTDDQSSRSNGLTGIRKLKLRQ